MTAPDGAPSPLLDVKDAEGIAQFRDVLRRAAFTEPDIRKALQTTSMQDIRVTDVHLMDRVLPREGLLPALIRMFLCTMPADRAEFDRLLRPLTVERLQALGIVRVDGNVVHPAVRMVPVNEMALVSDFLPEDVSAVPADFVLGINPTSVALDHISVRRPAARALDLGSGTGIQSLLMARHCERIVATDLNPRAVNFTAFNCALNGITNVDCRVGSLFEPVKGETFDLILCNPPFVVSPDSVYQFRDSGRPLDTFCREIVEGMGRHLAEGGFGEMLCSWVLRNGEAWSAPPRAWVAPTGCDALVFHTYTESPLGYANTWNRPLWRHHPKEFGEALDRWVAHFKRMAIDSVASGGIVLRKRTGRENWVAAMDVPMERDATAGVHVWRMFEAREWLTGATDDELLRESFAPSDHLRVEQAMVARDGKLAPAGIWAGLAAGFRFRGEIDPTTARLLALMDGKRRLGDLVETLAATAPRDEVRSKSLLVVREFYASGLLLRIE